MPQISCVVFCGTRPSTRRPNEWAAWYASTVMELHFGEINNVLRNPSAGLRDEQAKSSSTLQRGEGEAWGGAFQQSWPAALKARNPTLIFPPDIEDLAPD